MSEFIDCHCHLFNIMDIPLYETLRGEVNVGTLSKLTAASSFGLPAGIAVAIKVDSMLEKKEDYLKYFERSVENNINWLKKATRKTANTLGHSSVLITPLIMDFDCIGCKLSEDCASKGADRCRRGSRWDTNGKCAKNTESLKNNHNVYRQMERLQQAIVSVTGSDQNFKMCPYVGLDLRRLTLNDDSGLDELKAVWQEHGYKTANGSRSFADIKSGELLGIKLYPPIGFCPHPESDLLKQSYAKFFKWCCTEDIPITVHCQESSYSAGRKQKSVNKLTHPKNWRRLLSENRSLRKLRINFAHFGGEEGLEDMIDPWRFRANGLDKQSWTYQLIQILQTYPNAYADISAYDFADDSACENFAKVLDLSVSGELGAARYPLTEKLLWGSDIPMILSAKSYLNSSGNGDYSSLVARFRDAVFLAKKLTASQKNKLILKMTTENPKCFLRFS